MKIFPQPLSRKFFGLALVYLITSAIAFAAAFEVRFDGDIPTAWKAVFRDTFYLVILLKLVLALVTGQITALVRFFGLMDLRNIVAASTVSSCLIFLWSAFYGPPSIPRGVVAVDFLLFTSGVLFVRVVARSWATYRIRSDFGGDETQSVSSVAIIGAGAAAADVIREVKLKPSLRLQPVVVFDDDREMWGHHLHGVPIIGAPETLKEPRWREQVQKVIIALPDTSSRRIGEVARLCNEIGIPSETIPALDQLIFGRFKVVQRRAVQIEDLLRRDQVDLDLPGIRQVTRDQVVMVTGAGGSIGSELCRQILAQSPRLLVLVERSEGALFLIQQELIDRGGRNIIAPHVADITEASQIRAVLERHRPAIIFHAAAHKHVPMMEEQPAEALRNNSFGTALLAKMAGEMEVQRFVLVSTDKAINPTSVMGASKRLAEIYLQALQSAQRGGTRYIAVRFGNVLGSSGSVVPIFQKQILTGGPVKVTHPDMTRYFMTIPEAVGLILQSAAQGEGGEIFVLDMGEPVKILELARQMIQLSGLRPGEDIQIEFTGLRPGEKLFEELSHDHELVKETTHKKIFRFICPPMELENVEGFLQRVRSEMDHADSNQIKRSLQQFVPEYRPHLG